MSDEIEEPVITIYKVKNISSSHKLDLPYESKCNRLHGHNYKIEMWLSGTLDANGMVIDFNHLKDKVNELDHINLNEKFEWSTTAENIALHLCKELSELSSRLVEVNVRVWETESAYAEYVINP